MSRKAITTIALVLLVSFDLVLAACSLLKPTTTITQPTPTLHVVSTGIEPAPQIVEEARVILQMQDVREQIKAQDGRVVGWVIGGSPYDTIHRAHLLKGMCVHYDGADMRTTFEGQVKVDMTEERRYTALMKSDGYINASVASIYWSACTMKY